MNGKQKSMGKKIKTYFDILDYLEKKGPASRKEIIDALKIPTSTFHQDIDNLKIFKKVKQIGKRYALFNHAGYENEIERVIRSNDVDNNQPIPKEFFKVVAMLINVPYTNPDYKKAFQNVMERMGLSYDV